MNFCYFLFIILIVKSTNKVYMQLDSSYAHWQIWSLETGRQPGTNLVPRWFMTSKIKRVLLAEAQQRRLRSAFGLVTSNCLVLVMSQHGLVNRFKSLTTLSSIDLHNEAIKQYRHRSPSGHEVCQPMESLSTGRAHLQLTKSPYKDLKGTSPGLNGVFLPLVTNHLGPLKYYVLLWPT